MSELIQYNARVNSTEEYQLLVKQIREQGGHVVYTFALRDKGQGISVQYVVPVNKEIETD